MSEPTIHIVLLALHLFIPESQSLKTKRGVLNKLKDRLKNRFNLAVAEVGDMDTWQSSVFAITMVSNNKQILERNSSKILEFCDSFHDFEVLKVETEYL